MTSVRGSMTACALGLILIAPAAGAEDAAESPQPDPTPQAAARRAESPAPRARPTSGPRPPGTSTEASDSERPTVNTATFSRSPCSGSSGSRRQSASGAWRFGAGLQFGSMDPAEDPNIPPETAELWLAPDLEWARLETFLTVTRVFNPQASFRPYLQGRLGIERIHPRSELFWVQPPPEDLEPGDSPTNATNGIGFTLQPGFELSLGKSLSLDVGGFATYYKTGAYDMSPLGLPDVDSGIEWGARVGLAWRPYSATPARRRAQAPAHRPGHGQAAAASPARGESRRLGRAAELGLGDGRDVRDQLRRLDVQRIHPRRQLQPDQPAQLLGQFRGRLHVRRQQVQDQPARPSRSTGRPTSTPRAPTASASGARRRCRSPGRSSGSAVARPTRCPSTT